MRESDDAGNQARRFRTRRRHVLRDDVMSRKTSKHTGERSSAVWTVQSASNDTTRKRSGASAASIRCRACTMTKHTSPRFIVSPAAPSLSSHFSSRYRALMRSMIAG